MSFRTFHHLQFILLFGGSFSVFAADTQLTLVKDPLSDYRAYRSAKDYESETSWDRALTNNEKVIAVKCDLNGDAVEDLLLTDSAYIPGKNGKIWALYLSQPKKGFIREYGFSVNSEVLCCLDTVQQRKKFLFGFDLNWMRFGSAAQFKSGKVESKGFEFNFKNKEQKNLYTVLLKQKVGVCSDISVSKIHQTLPWLDNWLVK